MVNEMKQQQTGEVLDGIAELLADGWDIGLMSGKVKFYAPERIWSKRRTYTGWMEYEKATQINIFYKV
jgi:hypothetical protein